MLYSSLLLSAATLQLLMATTVVVVVAKHFEIEHFLLVPLAGRVLLFTFPVTVNCQRDNSRFAFVVQRNKCLYV